MSYNDVRFARADLVDELALRAREHDLIRATYHCPICRMTLLRSENDKFHQIGLRSR